eukprot:750480-Hanusia_phi.AAC.5
MGGDISKHQASLENSTNLFKDARTSSSFHCSLWADGMNVGRNRFCFNEIVLQWSTWMLVSIVRNAPMLFSSSVAGITGMDTPGITQCTVNNSGFFVCNNSKEDLQYPSYSTGNGSDVVWEGQLVNSFDALVLTLHPFCRTHGPKPQLLRYLPLPQLEDSFSPSLFELLQRWSTSTIFEVLRLQPSPSQLPGTVLVLIAFLTLLDCPRVSTRFLGSSCTASQSFASFLVIRYPVSLAPGSFRLCKDKLRKRKISLRVIPEREMGFEANLVSSRTSSRVCLVFFRRQDESTPSLSVPSESYCFNAVTGRRDRCGSTSALALGSAALCPVKFECEGSRSLSTCWSALGSHAVRKLRLGRSVLLK